MATKSVPKKITQGKAEPVKSETNKKKLKPRKKRRGVRFLITLLILIGAAGSVFWFGWVQYSLGEGDYGVIYTKSNGYEPEVLKNGEFAWRWQGLLPTNLTLHVFNLETRTSSLNRAGELPSGKLYAAMAGDNVSFNWEIDAKVVYRMNPDSLPTLVADGLVSSELDSFYSDFESKLDSELVRLIAVEIDSDTDVAIGERLRSLEKALTDIASSIDSRVIIVEASVLDWTYPDLALYVESRRLVLDFMSKKQAVMAEVEDSSVRRQDVQGNRLDLLEEYGRVLNEYPVLLELFALEGSPGTSLLPPLDVE
jgi:hypothetical protein